MIKTAEGGRQTPFLAGGSRYRPQFLTNLSDQSTTCFVDKVEGREGLSPGETGTITARLLRPEFFLDDLKPGKSFELHEGAQRVGWGTIKEVGDLSLASK